MLIDPINKPRPDLPKRRNLAFAAQDAVGRKLFLLDEINHLCASEPLDRQDQYRVLATFYSVVHPKSTVARVEEFKRVLDLLKYESRFDFAAIVFRTIEPRQALIGPIPMTADRDTMAAAQRFRTELSRVVTPTRAEKLGAQFVLAFFREYGDPKVSSIKCRRCY